jgi:EAL domain-containing protein (putative c-di-GMP-specific phosphodiesterase class I)
LLRLKVPLGQGYLFGRPAPVREARAIKVRR